VKRAGLVAVPVLLDSLPGEVSQLVGLLERELLGLLVEQLLEPLPLLLGERVGGELRQPPRLALRELHLPLLQQPLHREVLEHELLVAGEGPREAAHPLPHVALQPLLQRHELALQGCDLALEPGHAALHLGELGIAVEDFLEGLWRFRWEPKEKVRRSEKPAR
jgi:hypothetical protein